MSYVHLRRSASFVILLSVWSAAGRAWIRAEDSPAPAAKSTALEQAATLLPESSLVFATLEKPAEILAFLYDHPLRGEVEQLAAYKEAVQRKEYVFFRLGLAFVEFKLGKPWRPAVESLTAGGIHVAFNPKSEGVVLLSQADDPAMIEKARETLFAMARDEAKKKKRPEPVQESIHRGIKLWKMDQVHLTQFDRWLVLSNKESEAKAVLDRHLDGGASLVGAARFQQAVQSRQSSPAAWLWLDLEQLRAAGQAKQLFRGQAENFGVELLAGGVLGNMQRTPFLTAALAFEKQDLRLTFATPHDAAWNSGAREHYFGRDGLGAAPPLMQPESAVLSLGLYRDLGAMWRRAGDLFDEKTNDQMAQAESQLSTLFGGRDFGEDILSALQPQLQLVVARQKFERLPRPAIRLPAFALAGTLREPETMRGELRRTFQSLLGFLNIVGAQNGQPQLDQEMQRNGDRVMVAARYVPEDDEKESERARINFNFSPTIAFAGDQFVLASSQSLAEELLDAKPRAAASPANLRVVTQASVLRAILEDNHGQIVAQNILKKGQTKAEAAKEIDQLLAALKLIKGFDVKLEANQQLRLDLTLQLGKS